ncbi:DMT family transporter [uncultured Acetobacteroides sp.]|uniref:DMT family transporter n=1 Tax=uncultured Acetobacteroides sp. TaxID=1760811 RepID=UPI0029F5C23F|nr:DMT family transporter [uncultured Acetobacteroides sp.]
MKNSLLVYTAVILAILFWSLSFVWYKTALLYFTPTGIITFRLTLASVALLVVGLLLRQVQRLQAKDLRLFLTMAFFEPFIYSLCEANGLTMVSSTLAAVIVATIPLFTPLGAFLFFRERISLQNAIGILLSVVGVVLVAYQSGSQTKGSLLGIALMFGAVVAAIGYVISLKKLTLRYNSFSIVTYQSIIAALLMLPVFLATDRLSASMFTSEALVPILKLTTFASIIAFLLYAYSLKHFSIAKINVFLNLIPVFTAIAAYFMQGDRFNAINLVGIAVTLAGLYVSQVTLNARRAPIVKR